MTAGLAHFLTELAKKFSDMDFYVNTGVKGIPNARNRAAQTFLRSDHDRLFFLDSDVLPQDNAMELLEVEGDIVSGTYKQRQLDLTRQSNDASLKINYIGRDLKRKLFDFELRRVEEASFVPFGCVLIRREVIEDSRMWIMEEPPAMFDEVWTDDGRCTVTDDVSFCRRARSLGYNIRMHTGIRFGHVKMVDLEHFT